MADHEMHDSGMQPRAYSRTQNFDVYQDLSPEIAERVRSLEARFGRKASDGTGGSAQPSSTQTTSFTHGSGMLPGLENADGANDLSSPLRKLDFLGQQPFTPLEKGKRVLSNNSRKVNSPPRSGSHGTVDESLKNGPISGQKRRNDDSDGNLLSSKSPKIRHTKSRQQGHRVQAPKNDPIILGSYGEPPPSGLPAKASKLQEGSVSSRAGKQPISDLTGVEATDPDGMDIDIDTSSSPFTTFNGDLSTPRPQTMYTFGASMRTFNPIKVVGKLFGRSSHDTTPVRSKKDERIAQEVARQVEDQMQRIENKLYDKFVARQAAETMESRPGTPSSSAKPASELPLLSFELAADAYKKMDIAVSPTPAAPRGPTALENSSPLQSVRFKEDAARPRKSFERDNPPARRNLFGSMFRGSRSKDRATSGGSSIYRDVSQQPRSSMDLSKNGSPSKNDISKTSTDLNDTAVSPRNAITIVTPAIGPDEQVTSPRIKHKASQHLKKMASKMNLRGKKNNDVLGANNEEYKIMKKKNKDEILKDYMTLQREKQDLERQLANEMHLSAQKAKADSLRQRKITPDKRLARDMEKVVVTPNLLDSAIPDFSIKVDQNHFSNPPSPVKSTSQSSSTNSRAEPISENAGSQLPPVPEIPAKYKPESPKAVRNLRSTSKAANSPNWKGWDDDVF